MNHAPLSRSVGLASGAIFFLLLLLLWTPVVYPLVDLPSTVGFERLFDIPQYYSHYRHLRVEMHLPTVGIYALLSVAVGACVCGLMDISASIVRRRRKE